MTNTDTPRFASDALASMTELEFGKAWTLHRYGMNLRTAAEIAADDVVFSAEWVRRDAVKAENAFWAAHYAADFASHRNTAA